MECVPNTTKTQINTYKCKNIYLHSWQTKTIQENHVQNVHVITKVQFTIKTDKATTVGKKHNKIKNVRFTNNVHKKSLKKPKG